MTPKTGGAAGLADETGAYVILAIDHRDSLRAVLAPDDPDSINAADITAFKHELVTTCADVVTGVMLEPEYSIPSISTVLPAGIGFSAALESQGYLGDLANTVTTLLPGFGAEGAVACGAAAAKLLVPYRPDSPLASRQEAVARAVVDECRAAGIGLLLEPLLFGPTDSAAERTSLIVETARRFAKLDAAILKLPFPGDGCEDVTAVCRQPWLVLSGDGGKPAPGAPTDRFGRFLGEVRQAVAGGASGFAGGRAVWHEAAVAGPDRRGELLTTLVRQRLVQLGETVRAEMAAR